MNEWVLTALMAIAPHVGPPQLPPPGAPGPFAFGDDDRTRQVLEGAGWAAVDIRPMTTTMLVGRGPGIDAAVAFYTEDTFGRMLLDGATPEQRAAATRSLEEALVGGATEGGVELGAAAWIVTATKPG